MLLSFFAECVPAKKCSFIYAVQIQKNLIIVDYFYAETCKKSTETGKSACVNFLSSKGKQPSAKGCLV